MLQDNLDDTLDLPQSELETILEDIRGPSTQPTFNNKDLMRKIGERLLTYGGQYVDRAFDIPAVSVRLAQKYNVNPFQDRTIADLTIEPEDAYVLSLLKHSNFSLSGVMVT